MGGSFSGKPKILTTMLQFGQKEYRGKMSFKFKCSILPFPGQTNKKIEQFKRVGNMLDMDICHFVS